MNTDSPCSRTGEWGTVWKHLFCFGLLLLCLSPNSIDLNDKFRNFVQLHPLLNFEKLIVQYYILAVHVEIWRFFIQKNWYNFFQLSMTVVIVMLHVNLPMLAVRILWRVACTIGSRIASPQFVGANVRKTRASHMPTKLNSNPRCGSEGKCGHRLELSELCVLELICFFKFFSFN